MELATSVVPQLPPARYQVVPSAQQPVEGTTFQISCRRHGNLIAWAWTPGDTRQMADLQNLFRLLEPHHDNQRQWWLGSSICKLEFSTKAIKNV